MKRARLSFGKGFRVTIGNRYSQAAEMVIAPGDARRDRQEIRNVGRGLLKTLNFYVPPAYRKNGDPLPRGRK